MSIMVVDITVFLIFILSFWIGWSIGIAIDWVSIIWVLVFAVFITFVLPFFISFVDHSTAGPSRGVYYIFGLLTMGLIFICLYLLMGRKKFSRGVRRFIGSGVLALLATYSYMIVLISMDQIGWIDLSRSLLIGNIPNWILNPINY